MTEQPAKHPANYTGKEIDAHVRRIQQWMIDKHGYQAHDPGVHSQLAMFMRLLSIGQAKCGLFLCGHCGTGKTLFVRKFLNDHRWIRFFKMHELLNMYREDPRLLRDAMKETGGVIAPPHAADVILDDVGSEPKLNNYGTKLEVVQEAIIYRHDMWETMGAHTHITTNLSEAEFFHRYGDAVESRVKAMCNIIPFNGVDQRVTPN